MWRSFFLAVGISLGILGAECLVVDRAFVTLPTEPSATATNLYQSPQSKELVPPEWAPWSLLSAGAVVALYSLTVARHS